jgi:DNA-binding transcriptional regulator YhcF (GntR family)
MKKDLFDLIKIDGSLAVPIYKQIVQSVCRSIDNGLLAQHDKLPSVNSIAEKFSLARGSVFSAYNELRASGIIDSIPGKGYFVTSTQTKSSHKIFLLLSTFAPYRETLYNSIVQHMPKGSSLDIFFHNHNRKVFETLIREQAHYYNTFLIMPEIYDETLSVLSLLDPKHLFLLDTGYKQLRKYYPGIYQNFESDIRDILVKKKHLLSKYRRLFLIRPAGPNGADIVSGFKGFAKTVEFDTQVINDLSALSILPGDAFIVTDDNHLVELIQYANKAGLGIGRDLGILSYNESNLKSVIGNGISTITSDYLSMGKCIAEMISTDRRTVVENPFVMIDRGSL